MPLDTPADTSPAPPVTVTPGEMTRLDQLVGDDATGLSLPVLRMLVEAGAVPYFTAAGTRYVGRGSVDDLSSSPWAPRAAAVGLWHYLQHARPADDRAAAEGGNRPLRVRLGAHATELRVRPTLIGPWLIEHAQHEGFRLPMPGALTGLLDGLGAPWRRMATPIGEPVGQVTWTSYSLPGWLAAEIEAAGETP